MSTELYSVAELSGKYKLPEDSWVIHDAILMSEGLWNNRYYSREEIEKAFLETDWKSRENRHLFLDHHDQQAGEWLGEVSGMRFNKDTLYGDLVVHDPIWALKFKNGNPKLGISPKVVGEENIKDKTMKNFTFQNFSVVVNPAVKTAYINNMENLKMDKVEGSTSGVELKSTEPIEVEGVDAKNIKVTRGAFEKLSEAQKALESMLERPIQKTKEEINMEEKDLADLFELFEAKKLSVTKVMRKADEIQTEGESYKDALRRAGKLLQEEEPVEEETEEETKPEEETPKEEVPKEEAPVKEPSEETEALKEQIKEMKKEIKTLAVQANEPAKAKIEKKKDIQELSEKDLDLGMLEYLKTLGVD